MKFNFKKIATILGSAVLVGSTLGMAAAVNFPAPFSQEASAIVVGSSSAVATADVVAAANIASSISNAATTATATTGASASGGDSYKIDKSSTKFQLGYGIHSVISGTVTDDNLPTLLADGTFVDDDNDEFDFTQKIILSNATLNMFEDNDYKADEPTTGIKITSGAQVLNYTLDFTETPLWADLATTDITILGKPYYVLAVTTNTSMTLLDSAESTVIAEGETKTLTIGDKTYTVKINFVGSNQVKLDIDGKLTNTLAATETQKLSDEAYVGIKEINYNSKDTGISNVQFSIGTGKLKLSTTSVQINDETITGLAATFTNTAASALDKLDIIWSADEDVFIADGSEALMPGFGAIKLSWGGMTFPAAENLIVEPGSDTYFSLKEFPIKSSVETIPIAYYNESDFLGVGKDSTSLTKTSFWGNLTFDGDTDDMFIATWTDGKDSESYVMRATSFSQDASATINQTTIQYKSNGVWTDLKENAQPADSVSIGSVDLTVGVIDRVGKSVELIAGTNVNFNTIYSKEGMKVYLPYSNNTALSILNTTQYTAATACAAGNAAKESDSRTMGAVYTLTYNNSNTNVSTTASCTSGIATFNLIFSEEDRNENKGSGQNITLTFGEDSNSDVSITAATPSAGGTSTEVQNTDVYRNFVYSALASEVLWDKSATQYDVKIVYHGDESYGNVFLTAPSAVISGTTTPGTSTAGAVTVTDAEVSSVQTKNMVVVGGSCVNTVAAKLLGSTSALCGADFTTKTGVGNGQFLIQVFNSPYTTGKIAMLVAGYEAADTTKAATYLTTNTVNSAAGTVVKKTSATYADVA